MKEPRRLLDGGLGSFERALLESARDDAPPVAGRDAAATAIGLEATGGAAATAAAGKALPLWLELLAVGIVGGLVGIIALRGDEEARPREPAVVAPTRADAPAREVVAAPARAVANEPNAERPPVPELPPVRERPPVPTPVPGREPEPAPALARVKPTRRAAHISPEPEPAGGAVAAPEPEPEPEPAGGAVAEPEPEPEPEPAGGAVVAPEPDLPAEPDEFAIELRLVDAARDAIRRGDPAAALRVLARYRNRFPAGVLGPEAAVLRIEATLLGGDPAGAIGLAEQFLARHPHNPLARRVRSLLRRARGEEKD